MKIQRIQDERPALNAPVTVKQAGNVIEVRYALNGTPEITIEKLTADQYVDKRTGEVKEFQHKNNRAEDKASMGISARRQRKRRRQRPSG